MEMRIDSREVVQDLLQGIAPPRPLFLPIAFSLGARIENLSLAAFLANPTKITNALRQIRTHLRSDGVACYFDPFLELEALGGVLDWGESGPPSVRWPPGTNHGELLERLNSPDDLPNCGRVPVAVEVIRRLKSLLRDECLLLAGIIGPFTLAARLSQLDSSSLDDTNPSNDALEFASGALAPIATAFLEAGANMIFICEETLPKIDWFTDWASSLATTINIIRFYEAVPVLLLSTALKDGEMIFQQSWECILCPVLQDVSSETCGAFVKRYPANLGFALPVDAKVTPASDALDHEENLRTLLARLHPAIVTTAGNIPVTTDLKRFNQLRETVIG
jgi:Uroporphyrinogen decarboxylase (URO-D)